MLRGFASKVILRSETTKNPLSDGDRRILRYAQNDMNETLLGQGFVKERGIKGVRSIDNFILRRNIMFYDNRILGAQNEIINLKSDAKRWKIIAIVLFFVGVGLDRLLSVFLES